MTWPWSRKRDDRLDKLADALESIAKNQQQMSVTVMNTVQAFSEVASKQADILSKYLDLFKTPEEPRRWAEDPAEESRDELMAANFPFEGTEAEQAKWVLENLDKM